jgi:hypothetical protein
VRQTGVPPSTCLTIEHVYAGRRFLTSVFSTVLSVAPLCAAHNRLLACTSAGARHAEADGTSLVSAQYESNIVAKEQTPTLVCFIKSSPAARLFGITGPRMSSA